MTVAAPSSSGLPLGSPTAASAVERTRPFFAQALHDTFARRGAQFGLAWICVLAFLSVFAPFLASSFPLYFKDASGVESFPLFAQLTWIDVTLLASFIAFALLFFVPSRVIGWGIKLLILTAVTIAAAFIAAAVIHPPNIQTYARYRTLAKSGQTSSLSAPIPYSPSDRQRDQSESDFLSPRAGHILGTDRDSSDVASRLIHATRIALSIGFVSTGIQIVVGILIGGIMGYFAGKTDMFGMRLIEIFEAMPRLLVLITVTTFLGRNMFLIMVVIGLTSWPGTARYIRAEFLRLRNQDFVHAAVALGLPLRSILLRHMLPNGISPVLVSLSFGVASAILLESTLSFLGLGLVDSPSWGNMLDQARAAGGGFNWWMAVFPTLMIFMTVFAYNLIGEALRDALDPKLRQ